MRLGEKQELFMQLMADHLEWLFDQGYEVRRPTFFTTSGHRPNSNHYIGLAADLNLFLDGVYLTETPQHLESGLKWESRHELCRWGGNWDKDTHPGEPGEDDGNHYSLIHEGRM